jgi:hypothetical protein
MLATCTRAALGVSAGHRPRRAGAIVDRTWSLATECSKPIAVNVKTV